jgi:tRNA threonylcarbamoyl adenosine modification protein (Sua5/YciO/YrdC/YwlC family)
MDAVAALRAGASILLPTDTVYGLCALPDDEPVRRLYELKGRGAGQPTAIVAASVEGLRRALPELSGRDERIARSLLPGPFTLVVANPGRRFPWLTGSTPEAIGVRVPALPEAARAVVDAVGAVIATSANEPGGPDPATLEEVPQRIRDAVAAEVDAGRIGGVASTVVDVTGADPRILREGAVAAADTVARVRAALA